MKSKPFKSFHDVLFNDSTVHQMYNNKDHPIEVIIALANEKQLLREQLILIQRTQVSEIFKLK